MSDVKQQLERILCRLVDEPDEVVLDEDEVDETRLFQVRVAPDDMGKVIGRQGRTARALRTLLEVRGTDGGDYYDLEILES